MKSIATEVNAIEITYQFVVKEQEQMLAHVEAQKKLLRVRTNSFKQIFKFLYGTNDKKIGQ